MKAIKLLYKRFRDHRLIDLAAQCAYYLLLSLFPFLIFSVTLLSYLPFTFQDLYEFIKVDYIPPDVLAVVEDQWDVITGEHNTGLLSLGAVFTLWTASLALNSILRSLNLSYHVTEMRSMLLSRFMSILLTIGLLLVVVAAFVFQVIGDRFSEYLAFSIPLLDGAFFRWLLSFVILFVVFSVLYLIGPNIRLHVREVYIGALFAAIGWHITSLGFSFYLDNFANYSATYGTIGTVIALMVWFHASSLLILLGGEINAMIKEDDI
ncbi:YihY/virulence factor BrkB family protein [Bacillus shivajii]|uniref:YihY/virulence factor BrkB family protein n=1 Tax=Bacillus shivajii TaxID=1983719 RepID=UPI001CF9B082|nr:YihY/virulence factor BrkB family protein [Bacillus shivajii]UCZ53608.1 YihY/virulence factor BrkB family protein [Bacillus shivajii]